MSLLAPVKNGEIQDVTQSTSSTEKSSGSSLDKNAFLQLLVAQMKYQDPLEPTSNTEYISQLATFSELEEMQNMRGSIDLQRASSMVGQEVYIKTTNATTGSTDYVHGKVDYVVYENGKAYLSVNGNQYPLDDLDSIYDGEYTEAYGAAYDWTIAMNKLPALDKLTLSDEAAVKELKDTYDGMTDYQKTFITTENKEKLEDYVEKINLLIKAKEALEESKKEDAGSAEEAGASEEAGSTEEAGASEEAGSTEEAGASEEAGSTEEAGAAEETGSLEETEQAEAFTEAEAAGNAEGDNENEAAE